jgi:hypothetical protein
MTVASSSAGLWFALAARGGRLNMRLLAGTRVTEDGTLALKRARPGLFAYYLTPPIRGKATKQAGGGWRGRSFINSIETPSNRPRRIY